MADAIDRFREKEAKDALRATITLARGLIGGIVKGNPAFAEVVRDVVDSAESALQKDNLGAPAADHMRSIFDDLRQSAFRKAATDPGERHRAIQGGALDRLGPSEIGAPRRPRGK